MVTYEKVREEIIRRYEDGELSLEKAKELNILASEKYESASDDSSSRNAEMIAENNAKKDEASKQLMKSSEDIAADASKLEAKITNASDVKAEHTEIISMINDYLENAAASSPSLRSSSLPSQKHPILGRKNSIDDEHEEEEVKRAKKEGKKDQKSFEELPRYSGKNTIAPVKNGKLAKEGVPNGEELKALEDLANIKISSKEKTGKKELERREEKETNNKENVKKFGDIFETATLSKLNIYRAFDEGAITEEEKEEYLSMLSNVQESAAETELLDIEDEMFGPEHSGNENYF